MLPFERLQETRMLARLKNHDERALAWLIEAYGPLYKSVILRTLHDLPDEVAPCLQDTFLAVWQHIDTWDERRAGFKTWSCAIARYRAINVLYQERRRYAQKPLDGTIGQRDAALDWQMELDALLAPLSPADQGLFKELFILGLTPEEAAERRDTTRANIYNRISRGRRRLRDAREKGGE